MKVKELQALLQQVNPAAVLVSPRVLDRGLQIHFNLPTYRIWDLPHRSTLVVDRRTLVSFLDPDDLELRPEQLLPDTVILLAKPNMDIDGNIDDDTLLGIYWRRLFHATIHVELDRQRSAAKLTNEQIQERIEKLGPIIWDEAKKVLIEENWLTSEATQEELYVEFVAVFLELRYFLPNVPAAYFPAIENLDQVEGIIAEGLNVALLFAQTRLPGAKDPTPLADPGTDEANEHFNRIVAQAIHAARQGNLVRAAILRVKASRVAPAERTDPTRSDARDDLTHLVERLRKALGFNASKSTAWVACLDKLLEKADQDRFPVEAAILFDIQNACQDYEREIYTLSLVDWALSAGRRPVQRPLPSQRMVLILKHLRNAQSRLTAARITQEDRDKLNALIQESLDTQEAALRERYRPILKAHLEDSGFVPRNVPEEAASEKLIEEILDRFIEAGFLGFSDVRDILARNQMKMRDLASPQEFLRGDGLLQLDKRLGIALDGVYRPGEVYLRALERTTSLFFGTPFGRVLTLFLALPFGAGFLLAQTFFYLGHFLHIPVPPPYGDLEGGLTWHLIFSGGLGLLVFAFLHWPGLRRATAALGRGLFWMGKELFVKLPEEIARSSVWKSFVESWPFQLFYWILFTPLLLTAILWLCFPPLFETLWHALTIFICALILVGTRPGRGMIAILGHLVWRFVAILREGLIQGLVRFLIDFFRQLVHLVESLFHVVDEWLRFRSGEGNLTKWLRAFLALVWFPVSYLARFYFLVLIEPGYNPVKMPISIVLAKLMSPVWYMLMATWPASLEPIFGQALAYAIAGSTATLLPDAVTFLLWELSSNWQLYETNRPKALAPVVVGSHGETIRGLLQPGFHSGTIPMLYQKLRRTKKQLYLPQSWKLVRQYERQLEEVKHSVKQFVARNMLALLKRNKEWAGVEITVAKVCLGVASIRIVLRHPEFVDHSLVLEFSLQDGWLVGGMAERGWFDELEPQQLWPLHTALAALYKLAGVQLVVEQIERILDRGASFDITRDALVVWRDPAHESGYRYLWGNNETVLLPRELKSKRLLKEGTPPSLPASQVIYARVPLLWTNFVEACASESGPKIHADILPTGRRLVVSGRTTVMESSLERDRAGGPGHAAGLQH
jgi:hypothetical protein